MRICVRNSTLHGSVKAMIEYIDGPQERFYIVLVIVDEHNFGAHGVYVTIRIRLQQQSQGP